ncbi:Trypanosome variant surface glycoprotein (A-type), putative [Trypanosoma equiperdum]|uniref:Trypanosome variant surface glycoprotein (A-type), putative n=1 Tax=Trypanosoma equiperdum TaxID=5694 RepID=A0A1G4IGE7_TRYEQ|nr:Trypanosome variant surface glycoprotein (A-type), putative [Trypanosoma equiperdum]
MRKVTTLASLADRLEQTQLRCGIFAITSEDEESAKQARILQVYFKRKANAAAAQLGREAVAAAVKATHAASYGQGRLTEFLAIAVQTASSGKSCILDNSGSPVAAAKTLTERMEPRVRWN